MVTEKIFVLFNRLWLISQEMHSFTRCRSALGWCTWSQLWRREGPWWMTSMRAVSSLLRYVQFQSTVPENHDMGFTSTDCFYGLFLLLLFRVSLLRTLWVTWCVLSWTCIWYSPNRWPRLLCWPCAGSQNFSRWIFVKNCLFRRFFYELHDTAKFY